MAAQDSRSPEFPKISRREALRLGVGAMTAGAGLVVLKNTLLKETPPEQYLVDVATLLDKMEQGQHGFDALSGSFMFWHGVNVRTTPDVSPSAGVSDASSDNLAFTVGVDTAGANVLIVNNPLVVYDAEGQQSVGFIDPRGEPDELIGPDSLLWIALDRIRGEVNEFGSSFVFADTDNTVIKDLQLQDNQFVSKSFGHGPIAASQLTWSMK